MSKRPRDTLVRALLFRYLRVPVSNIGLERGKECVRFIEMEIKINIRETQQSNKETKKKGKVRGENANKISK